MVRNLEQIFTKHLQNIYKSHVNIMGCEYKVEGHQKIHTAHISKHSLSLSPYSCIKPPSWIHESKTKIETTSVA